MNFNAENLMKKTGLSKARHKAVMIAAAALLSLSVAAGAALAAGHEDRRSDESRESGAYESKIYGIVEKLPPDGAGTWVVNGREIVVTKDTRIKEKHGRVEVGTYVEVEGNVTGRTFMAYEVEVKRSKRSGR